MKFTVASLISLVACTVAIAAPTTAFAQEKTPEEPLNYFGVGASNRGAAFESKLSINNRFSVRPMATSKLFEEGERHATIYVPVTYDFSQTSSGLRPFIGGGAGVTTDDRQFGGVVTTGADYRINKRLTAVGSVNVGFFDDRDFTAVLGVATNFNK
ncbi:MAG: hypothetical protein AAF915_26895 [Cyanobacteria bacterium P01_D01_bin.50]